MDRNLLPLFSNLIDCFVNYNLSLFDEIYSKYRNSVFYYLDNIDAFKTDLTFLYNDIQLLSYYLLYYLDFNYIIIKQDREKRKEEINDLLNFLKEICNQKSSSLNDDKFKSIDDKLKLFSKVKSTDSCEEILKFILNIIKSISFWDQKTLQKQFKLFFPEIDIEKL